MTKNLKVQREENAPAISYNNSGPIHNSTKNRSSRSEVACKMVFITRVRKHLCQSLFFNKVAALRPATLLKKRFWQRCFPVKFLRAPFFTEHLWWLLLEKASKTSKYLIIIKNMIQQNSTFLLDNTCGIAIYADDNTPYTSNASEGLVSNILQCSCRDLLK